MIFVFQMLVTAEARKIVEKKIFANFLTMPNNSENKVILIMNTIQEPFHDIVIVYLWLHMMQNKASQFKKIEVVLIDY